MGSDYNSYGFGGQWFGSFPEPEEHQEQDPLKNFRPEFSEEHDYFTPQRGEEKKNPFVYTFSWHRKPGKQKEKEWQYPDYTQFFPENGFTHPGKDFYPYCDPNFTVKIRSTPRTKQEIYASYLGFANREEIQCIKDEQSGIQNRFVRYILLGCEKDTEFTKYFVQKQKSFGISKYFRFEELDPLVPSHAYLLLWGIAYLLEKPNPEGKKRTFLDLRIDKNLRSLKRKVRLSVHPDKIQNHDRDFYDQYKKRDHGGNIIHLGSEVYKSAFQKVRDCIDVLKNK